MPRRAVVYVAWRRRPAERPCVLRRGGGRRGGRGLMGVIMENGKQKAFARHVRAREFGTDYPCVASADASLRPGRTGPIRRAGGWGVCRWVVARARAHRVERAEALVLDDAAGDREGAAGGAELEADLRGEGGEAAEGSESGEMKMRRAGVGWLAVGGSAGRRSPARGGARRRSAAPIRSRGERPGRARAGLARDRGREPDRGDERPATESARPNAAAGSRSGAP